MKKLTTILLVLSLLSIPIQIHAAPPTESYVREFQEEFGTNSSVTSSAKSPFRSATNVNTSDYRVMTSKNNQPRDEGISNPHQGTDMRAAADDIVYPILPGTIVDHFTPGSSDTTQLGYITINHDTNLDGVADNVYVKYLHIIPTITIVNGTTKVTQNTQMAKVDKRKQFPPHLHIQRLSSTSGGYTMKMFNFFRWVNEWNLGSDFDYLSGDVLSSNNNFYITGYTYSDGVRSALSKLQVYYKIGSSGTWSTTPYEISTYDTPSIYRYKINLKTATGANTGDTVYIYIVGVRNYSGSYKTSLFPQYYKAPYPPLTASRANTIAVSYTIV